MSIGRKFGLAACGGLLLSGCTTAEWEALAVGLSVAAIVASEAAAQSANQSISCPYGQHIEYGYDSYGNEVAFCIDDQPWSGEQSQQQR